LEVYEFGKSKVGVKYLPTAYAEPDNEGRTQSALRKLRGWIERWGKLLGKKKEGDVPQTTSFFYTKGGGELTPGLRLGEWRSVHEKGSAV